jgi:hypothetical protein
MPYIGAIKTTMSRSPDERASAIAEGEGTQRHRLASWCGRRLQLGVGFALGSAALGAYVGVTAAALNALIVASATFPPADQGAMEANSPVDSQPLPLMGLASPEMNTDLFAADDLLSARRFQEAAAVLTITVDIPGGSIDIYCATTTRRAQVTQIRVTPQELLDVFHQRCNSGASD